MWWVWLIKCYSLSEVATTGSYIRPKLTEKGKGDIVLTGARHPCLELQDNVSFIANDVSLIRGKISTSCNIIYIEQVKMSFKLSQDLIWEENLLTSEWYHVN